MPHDLSDAAWLARAREALARTDIMAISTLRPDGSSWTCPVQFQHDDDFTLYFASLPHARHVAHLEADPRISIAIYSVPGPPGGNLGLQLAGTAHRIDSSDGGWQRYRISVDECWCFDSRVGAQPHMIAL